MNLKPGQDMTIKFKNETDSPRTEEELEELLDALNQAAEAYDFSILQFGSEEAMRFSAIDETVYLDRGTVLNPEEVETWWAHIGGIAKSSPGPTVHRSTQDLREKYFAGAVPALCDEEYPA